LWPRAKSLVGGSDKKCHKNLAWVYEVEMISNKIQNHYNIPSPGILCAGDL
jgi:hypothetical protein